MIIFSENNQLTYYVKEGGLVKMVAITAQDLNFELNMTFSSEVFGILIHKEDMREL